MLKKGKRKKKMYKKKSMTGVGEQSSNNNLTPMKKKAHLLWRLRNSCKMVKKVVNHQEKSKMKELASS